MVIFLGLVIVLIFIQNGVAVGLSKVIGLDSLIGMCTGSIPMVGGHGTGLSALFKYFKISLKSYGCKKEYHAYFFKCVIK